MRLSTLAAVRAGIRSRAWDVTDRAAVLAENGRDIIDLGVGDPDFATPDVIVAAARDAMQRGRTHYAPIAGEPALREAIAAYTASHFEVSVQADEVCVFPGAQNALYAALNCVAGPGDDVLILEPFYATYEGAATGGGAEVRSLAAASDRGFLPGIDAIAESIRGNTRVIVVNSPGNPTGAVFDDASWSGIARLVADHDLWLVSDEVYANFVYEGRHRTALSLDDVRHRVIVVNSVSKSHAMTGWRLGWAIAPTELIRQLVNLSQCMNFGVSQFIQDAAVVALSEGDGASAGFADALCKRRDCLYGRLSKIEGLQLNRPAGGMFVMVEVTATGLDGEQFANRLLDEAGVAVVPGFAFGDSVTNYIRVGYIADTQTLERAADRIERFVDGLLL